MSACKVEVKDYICTVTIDRPPANATSKETYDEIRDTFYALDRREDIKVVILTGASKIFMAGNELSEFGEFMEPSKCTVHYDRIRNAYLAVKNCRYPVIGAINGSAAGAGCAFAGCCDVLIAAQGAKFALSEIKVGIIGADGYASLMVPEKVLRYMVVPREQVLEEAQKLAAEFAQNARRALILWKQCLNENYEHELPKKFNNNLQATIAYQPYHDFKEASTAFIEKRVPEYDEQ